MLKSEMAKALNVQLTAEFYSAYLYLSMDAYFELMSLKGFANWMNVQYKEETDHAVKFYRYLLSQGAEVTLLSVKEPPHAWNSPLHAFEETLKHEQGVTENINNLSDMAEKMKDRATYNFMQWYVNEQVEEEDNDREIIDRLKLIGGDKSALFMLDKELAMRQYVPLLAQGKGGV